MELASRRSLLAAVAAAAALAVAGCGDDEETDTAAQEETTEQTDTGGGESTVEVSGVEYAFEPPDPTVEEDGQISIEFTNDGQIQHALEIEELEESTETIEGGQSTTLTTSLDSGDYTIYCPVGDHRERGMEGTLTVGGGGGGGDDDSGSDDGSDDDSGSAGSGGGY